LYDSDAATGWRFPWDIPVEDYLFGFALLTMAMLLWETAAPRHREHEDTAAVASPSEASARGAPS
jgi:hypothetical protein